MKKTLHLPKRTLSLVLCLLMIMSLCVVSAEHTINTVVPEQGVILFDDFEDWTVANYAWNTEMVHPTTGIWSNVSGTGYQPFTEHADGNTVYAVAGKNGVNQNAQPLRLDLEKDASIVAGGNSGSRRPGTLNSGKVMFSFDVSIPSVFDGAIIADDKYPAMAPHFTNIIDGVAKVDTYGQGKLFIIERDASNIMVSCYLTPGVNGTNPNGANPKKLSYRASIPAAQRVASQYYKVLPGFDSQGNILSYNIKTLFDYDNGILEVYIDDNLYYIYPTTPEDLRTNYNLGQITVRPLGSFYTYNQPTSSESYGYDKDGDYPEIDVDNVKLAKVGPLSATLEEAIGKTITVDFSADVTTASGTTLLPSDFTLINKVTGSKETISAVTLNGDKLTLTTAKTMTGTYGLTYTGTKIVHKDLPQKYKLENGLAFDFTVSTILVEEDFDTNFPFDSTDSRYTADSGTAGSWAGLFSTSDGCTTGAGVNDTAPTFEQIYSNTYWDSTNDWRFYYSRYHIASDKANLYKVVADTKDGGNIMEYDIGPANRAQGGATVVIPFDNGASVSTGVVTAEFEVAHSVENENYRVAFGLRDKNNVNLDYSYATRWTPATVFGGFTYYSTTQKALTAATEYARSAPKDAYYSPLHVENGYTVSTKLENTKYDMGAVNFIGINNMQKVKFVADLDNEKFDVYLNGELKGSFDYLPGGVSGSEFDAFTLTSFTPNNFYNNPDISIYLDNVRVTHQNTPITLTSSCLEKYDGTTYPISGLVSAGTMGATLTFSRPLSGSLAGKITLSGSDIDDYPYTISQNGKTVTLDFTNGLEEVTTYVLWIDGDLLGSSDIEMVFSTDGGTLTVTKPTIMADGVALTSLASIKAYTTIVASSTMVNTQAKGDSARIFLASYKDGVLTAVCEAKAEAVTGETVLSVTSYGGHGFMGVDSIRAFVFSGTDETLRPLADSIDIQADIVGSAAFTGTTATLDNFTSAGLSVGTPTVETAGGRTGWRLNADDVNASYILFNVKDTFMYGLDRDERVLVEVDYYDDNYGGFALCYKDNEDVYKHQYVQLTNTKTWKTASFYLYDANFNNKLLYADFAVLTNDTNFRQTRNGINYKIMGKSPTDVLLGGVRVYKENCTSPYKITVETGKPGNVFFTGDEIKFNISYEDLTEKGISGGTATYTVKNYSGATVHTVTQTFTGNSDVLTLPSTLAYNLYTLDIRVVGANNLKQSTMVDFSHSRIGKTNLRFGTNVHVDIATQYTEEDIKAQLDLVKNAGYGFARTKISWNSVEPNADGQYSIPALPLAAHKYMEEIGIENLCILTTDHQNSKYLQPDDYNVYCTMKTEAIRQAYAKFCGYVVSDEGVGKYTRYFSISNEFNLHGQPVYDPTQHATTRHQPTNYQYYVPIVKAAYTAIKEEKPGLQSVVIAGELGEMRDEWTENCFELGIGDYCDKFSYHTYERATGPEYYSHNVVVNEDGTTWDKTYSPLASAQDASTIFHGKGVWLTETGGPSRADNISSVVENSSNSEYWNGNPIPATHTEEAYWLPRSLATVGYHVQKMFHYNFTNNDTQYFEAESNFGIINAHDYRTPFAAKPAYLSIAAYMHFMGDTDPVSYNFVTNEVDWNSRGYYVKANSKEYGEVWMLWQAAWASGTKTKSVSISGANTLEYFDMYGNSLGVVNNGHTFTLGQAPIYVIKKS